MARNRKLYTYEEVDDAIAQLANKGYKIIQLEDGCLANGHIVALAPDDRYYSYETREVQVNCWSSAQTWRKFRNVSERLQREIDDFYDR